MIKKKLTFPIYILLILILYSNPLYSKINSEILFKINEEIITTVDLENEKKFLLFLNPDLKNLSSAQIKNISINSLENRKIKELELKKFINFDNINISTTVDNFILTTNFGNKEILIKNLEEVNLNYSYFENNFLIDNLWRDFVLNKFKSKVIIDKDNIRKKIKSSKKEVKEYNLSEILFKGNADKTLEQLTKEIFSEIDRSGFEAATSLYSISDSKNFGGKLGWIKSTQISEEIFSEIKKAETLTRPIKTSNGYLILKINETRITTEKINVEEEFNRLVNLETQKELNRFGYIYFNKLKKKVFISEN